MGTKWGIPDFILSNNVAKRIPKKIMWEQNNKWLSVLTKAIKIDGYIKQSAVWLCEVTIQQGARLNYRNGNDANSHWSGQQMQQHRQTWEMIAFHNVNTFPFREKVVQKALGYRILHSQVLFLAINFCIFKVDLSFKKLILLIHHTFCPLPQGKQTQGRWNLGGN